MTFSMTEEIKRTFDLASLRLEAGQNLSEKEWREYQDITKHYDGQRRFEQRAHELEYDTRFEIARKRLLHQAGKKTRDFRPRWFGNDRFDAEAMKRQADRDVKHQHRQVLARLEEQELKDIEALLNRCGHRRRLSEKPKKDFGRAAERRSGKDRRMQRS